MRRLALLVLLATVSLAAAARAAEYTVVIEKMKFGPVPAELHPGDVIVWQNRDIFRHTATARDKSFDVDLPAHAEVRMDVGASGTVEVYCRFHPGMKAALVITP